MDRPAPLDPEHWARAASLFDRLSELTPQARGAELALVALAAPEVHALVQRMLASDEASQQVLDRGLEGVAPLVTPPDEHIPAAEPGPDRRVGPYRLLRVLGQGGMGVVYLAERDDPELRQVVALKCLPTGRATAAVMGRFLRERRILAGLVHPHIAQLHDGGFTESGEPYFAMEYVEGERIDDYCDRRRLSIDERLRLFGMVCQAVQYAHQHLVVHRDLKPGNVFVTSDGQVKLLDFGIAKVLEDPKDPGRASESTVRALTPEYASPEQIVGEPVTAASDVFALGLVLFELLTGRRAFTPEPGPLGPVRAILDTDPTRASTAAITGERARPQGATTADRAAARATTPERLRRRLEGDLDRIVLKALEKKPSLRYQSAQELVDDLERHQRGLPIRATPNTLGYRLRKFGRRHRAGVTATVVGLVLVAAFAGFHTRRITGERDRAQAEATKARTTTRFLQRLLGDAYPSVARGDAFSMSALMSRAVARVDSLSEQADIQAELLRTLGDVYREQGRFDEALTLLTRAVALHRASGEPRSRAAGEALSALGHLQYERKQYEAAWTAHGESREIFERILAPDDTLVLFALNNMATAASAEDRFEDALRLHREVLARRRRLFADTSQLVHTTHNNLGVLYEAMGNRLDAVRELRETLRLRRVGLPADHPSIALVLSNLGNALRLLDQLDEAEGFLRESLGIFQRVFGPGHHRVGLAAYNLARVLEQRGSLVDAESLYVISLDIDRKTYGENSLDVATDLRMLGIVLRKKGDCAGAEAALRRADAVYEANGVALAQRRRLITRTNLAACLGSLRRHREAEDMLVTTHQAAEAANVPADSLERRETLRQIIDLYIGWGRPAEAEAYRQHLADAKIAGAP